MLVKRTKLLAALTGPSYKQTAFMRCYGRLDMPKALAAAAPCIGQLQKQLGDPPLYLAIGRLFAAAALWHGVALKEEEVQALTQGILSDSELRSLKLEDLVVVAKEIQEADWHKRLTLNQIMCHVRGYWKRRLTRSINDRLDEQATRCDNSDFSARLARPFRLIQGAAHGYDSLKDKKHNTLCRDPRKKRPRG